MRASKRGEDRPSRARSRLTPRTQSAIRSARYPVSWVNSTTSSSGIVDFTQIASHPGGFGDHPGVFGVGLALPAKRIVIVLTTRPGT